MGQKIPSLDDADIRRLIKREFPLLKFTDVEGLLEKYKSDSENGKYRVYASILKLSEGNIDLVKKYVEEANSDYRDIIAPAEYPNYTEYGFGKKLSIEKKNELTSADWAQYEAWLNKE